MMTVMDRANAFNLVIKIIVDMDPSERQSIRVQRLIAKAKYVAQGKFGQAWHVKNDGTMRNGFVAELPFRTMILDVNGWCNTNRKALLVVKEGMPSSPKWSLCIESEADPTLFDRIKYDAHGWFYLQTVAHLWTNP